MSHVLVWKHWIGVRIVLTESGMSQKDAAKKLGWSESKMSRTLTGERRLSAEDVIDLVRVFGYDPEFYLYGYREISSFRVLQFPLGRQTQPAPQLALAS